ncbi:MAG: FG-GAP-like repeat-containing protein [Candidatus Peribacter sp.]
MNVPLRVRVRFGRIVCAAGAVAACLFPLAVWADAVTFTKYTVDYNFGGAIDAVPVDLDGDGDVDIVATGYQEGAIAWYRNNGSQSFTEVTIDATLSAPYDLSVIDLDKDGDLDVLATDYGSNIVIWYENDGSENFAARQTIDAAFDGPLHVAAEDLSGDGEYDVIVTGPGESALTWYINDGNESFTEYVIDDTLLWSNGFDTADFDGDGDKDIIAGSSGDNDIFLFLNSGTGSFTKITVHTASNSNSTFDAADIDEDGDQDFVVTAAGDGDIYWFENQGDGTGTGSFIKYVVDADFTSGSSVEVADVDGDDDNDFVVGSKSGDVVVWYDNDGSESFTKRTIASFNYVYNAHPYDVDQDGDMDIVAAAYDDNDIAWWDHFGTTNPDVTAYSPTDNATGVSQTANLVLTFDTAVQGGTGSIVLKKSSDNSTVETIAATGELVTGSGTTTITINPDTILHDKTGYYVTIEPNAFHESTWLYYAGISTTTTWNFTTVDVTGPVITLTAYAPDPTTDSTPSLTGTVTETGGTVGLVQYRIDGGSWTSCTSNDGSFNEASEDYTCTPTAQSDGAHTMETRGRDNSTVYTPEGAYGSDSFTVDTAVPAPSGFSPASGETIDDATPTVTFSLNENGNCRASTDGDETYDEMSDDTACSGSGTQSISCTLADLGEDGAKTVYVACMDTAGNKDTAATNEALAYTLATSSPSVSTLSPADDATNVSTLSNLVITFDKVARAGTGTLTIKKTSNNATVETITVSGALLSGNGTTELTFNPATTLNESTEYYVVWEANAFKSAGGRHTAIQASTTYWSFTTGDFTAPGVSALSPADNATDVSWTANLVLTFDETARAGTGVLTIKKTSNDATVEAITVSGALLSGNGSASLTFNPATTLDESTGYYVVWEANAFKDASVNRNHTAVQSSTTYWSFTTVGEAPAFTAAASASVTSSTATITWETDENASTRLHYGLTSALGTATNEADTGAGVTAHEVALSDLPACTTYHFRPVSRDPSANTATGSLATFTTTGCTNDATVSSQTGSSITTAGGSLAMTSGGSGTALTVPADAATNTIALQIKKLDKDTVIAVTSTPSGVSVIGDHMYDLRAISGATLVTSFLQPIAVEMEYTDAQVSGYAEATLQIYRWDGSSWNELSDCTVDTSANTVSCTTTAFSTFGLFGEEENTGDDSASASTTQSAGGRRGSQEDMTGRIEAARQALMARFEGKRQENAVIAATVKEIERSQWDEKGAAEREARIAARIAEHEAEIARIEQTKAEFEKKFALHREERMALAIALEEKHLAEAQAALSAEQETLKAEQETNAERRGERLALRDRLDSRGNLKGAATSLKLVAERRGRLYAAVDEVPVLFADVPLSAWFAPYVSFMVEEKIATGYADATGKPKGEFGVGNPVTYAEVLKMALNVAGKSAGNLPPPRNASAQGTWASSYVAQAEAMNLSVFTPSLDVRQPATRGAVIQTILETMGIPIANQSSAFSDFPPDHPYAKAIATAAFYGLIGGDTDDQGNPLNTFRPDAPITRAEVAKIIALVKEVMGR